MTKCSEDIDKAEAGDLRFKTKNVGNPKYMTLKQLESITEDSYFRGMHGADYETIKEEIEERLWELQNKKLKKIWISVLKKWKKWKSMKKY